MKLGGKDNLKISLEESCMQIGTGIYKHFFLRKKTVTKVIAVVMSKKIYDCHDKPVFKVVS